MSNDKQKEFFRVLDNEMRRRIILYLARDKAVTFTQIMNFLELDPLWQCGTIGYHLKLLVTSGIAHKHEDGYILTSRGKSIANVIGKIENMKVDEKLNMSIKTEEILKRLNPRFVCWLLAVSKGVKPTATILSVDKEDWNGFLRALDEFNLCWSYNGINGKILSSPENEAKLFYSLSTKSSETRVNFLFNDENWEKLIYEKKPSFQIVSSSSAKLTPLDSQGFIPIYEIVISKNLEELITFARFNQRGSKPACWGNHVERGKALGYPDCCINAFDKDTFVKDGKVGLMVRHNFFKELIDLGLDEKMPVEFWAIAHVPCSAKCEESLKLGRKYLDAVKAYSSSLYDYVQERLRVSYLAYSVGERFLGVKEVPKDQFTPELTAEYNRIFDWAKKIVSEDVKIVLGEVQRPLVYSDWEDYPARCRLIPSIRGLKWIAYAPEKGMLVRDTKTNEVYMYLMLKWVLPNEYEEIIISVCRIYRCN